MSFAEFARQRLPRFTPEAAVPIANTYGSFYMFHGRLFTETGGTDENGVERDGEFGFTGPTLHGVIALRMTYSEARIEFVDEESHTAARAATGWPNGVSDYSLEPQYEDGLLRIYNHGRDRFEFFGDWGIE